MNQDFNIIRFRKSIWYNADLKYIIEELASSDFSGKEVFSNKYLFNHIVSEILNMLSDNVGNDPDDIQDLKSEIIHTLREHKGYFINLWDNR